MSSIEINPCDGVGAEILGVDINNLSAEEDSTIREAFAEHGVIFFRDQSIDENAHIAFAERFGEININRFFAAHPQHPKIAMVLKDVNDRENIGGGWHTDLSYDAEPALGSILVARELPASGGDTRFAGMYKAYETLPDDLKSKVEGKSAIHSARHVFGSKKSAYGEREVNKTGRISNSEVADEMEDVIHPIVIHHPLSGKQALYVNPGFTIGVEGMDHDEGADLLRRLYAHAMKPEHVYQFSWKPGSIAFWDNRSTWHWALNDYHGQRRVMHRITIEGCPLH